MPTSRSTAANPSTGSSPAEPPRLQVAEPHIRRIAAASGALAVLLGAFGAHALEGAIDAARAEVFKTASFYHFVHVLALLLCTQLVATRRVRYAARAFGWGQLVFCGSLYLLATRGLIGLESASWLGAITPLGGLAFVAGWILLALERGN